MNFKSGRESVLSQKVVQKRFASGSPTQTLWLRLKNYLSHFHWQNVQVAGDTYPRRVEKIGDRAPRCSTNDWNHWHDTGFRP
jgi:hypothetical protein